MHSQQRHEYHIIIVHHWRFHNVNFWLQYVKMSGTISGMCVLLSSTTSSRYQWSPSSELPWSSELSSSSSVSSFSAPSSYKSISSFNIPRVSWIPARLNPLTIISGLSCKYSTTSSHCPLYISSWLLNINWLIILTIKQLSQLGLRFDDLVNWNVHQL